MVYLSSYTIISSQYCGIKVTTCYDKPYKSPQADTA